MFIFLILKVRKAFHMLQQNWYNDGNRYVNWVIQNLKKVFLNIDLFFMTLIFLEGYHAQKAAVDGIKVAIKIIEKE